MSNNIKDSIWLIGPGNIGRDYIKVLKKFDLDITVIGRSKKNDFPLPVYEKGIESYFKFKLPNVPKYAIVAVNESQLYKTTKILLEKNVKISYKKDDYLKLDRLLKISLPFNY